MVRLPAKYIAHSIQFLMLVLLITAALYVSVGRILVSVSDPYSDNFAQWLEGILGVPVAIGSVEGDWSYFDPRLTVRDVSLGSSVSADQVTMQIDAIRSLIERSLVITTVEFGNLEAELEERDPRNWQLVGFPESSQPVNLDFLFDSLPHLSIASIESLNISLKGIRGEYAVSADRDQIQLLAGHGQKSFSLPLRLVREDTQEASNMRVLGNYVGDPRNDDFQGEFYTEVSGVRLEDFLHGLGAFERFSDISINGEFWLSVNAGHTMVTSEIDVGATLERPDEENLAVRGTLLFGLEGFGDHYDVFGKRANIVLGDKEIHIEGLHGVISNDLRFYGLIVPTLDLQGISSSISSLGPSVTPRNMLSVLNSISPRGLLKETVVYAEVDSELKDFRFVSLLDGARVNAYLGSPAIDQLNGLISIGMDSGYIDIDNDQFNMHFESMFKRSWPFSSARGRINYRYDGSAFRFSSGLIELLYGDLAAYGKLQVNLPTGREQHTWGLAIGINDGDLLDAHRYLPNTLSPQLLSWLDTSVKGGDAQETGLLFHGSLFRGSPKIRKVFETYFRVDDAILAYHPDWPVLSHLDSTIYLNNAGVYSDRGNARVLESDVSNVRVSIPIPYSGVAETVSVIADVRGPLVDGIKVLNDTPIAEQISNVARNWSGTGGITGRLKLDIPLGDTDREVSSDVHVTLNNNDIQFPEYDLEVANLEGTIRYENSSGLTSEQYTGVLFRQEVSGFIGSELSRDSGEIIINVIGEVDASDIYSWSGQSLLSRMTGKSSYDTSVHIPFGEDAEPSYVQATSDLAGVSIDMPYPIGKGAEEERLLYYRQEFLQPGFQIDLALGTAQASLLVHGGLVRGGVVHLGPNAPGRPQYDAVRVTGSFSKSDYEEWDQFFLDMEAISDVSLESELAQNVESIVLDIGELNLYSLLLESVRANITRSSDAWNVVLVNEVLTGEVIIEDDDEKPLVVKLDYLRFPVDEAESFDPMAEVLPQELGDIDFSTKELMYGEEDYGSWSFQLRPNEQGASMVNLSAEVKGISLERAQLDWRYDELHSSTFSGNVNVSDLGTALREWGYASSIEGSDFNLAANFGWEGTPAAIDMDLIAGDIQLLSGKGRFIQAETGTGALKLLGIFDFAQIARRLSFDFSDVVDKGWSFNKISGSTSYNKGMIDILDPIVIEGSSSNFKIAGTVNLETRALDNDLIATLPVSRNLPWYAAYSAIVTGPLVGAAVMIAQKVLGPKIDQFSSAKYKVRGTIEDPQVVWYSLFDDSVRETAVDESPSEEGKGDPFIDVPTDVSVAGEATEELE
ncbi:MAG TPA: TIGR02099 family protein [Gammaproteobacteria bacterium]|nr:TIGR02099 family protein [Gammaproteobacteria bacterium]